MILDQKRDERRSKKNNVTQKTRYQDYGYIYSFFCANITKLVKKVAHHKKIVTKNLRCQKLQIHSHTPKLTSGSKEPPG